MLINYSFQEMEAITTTNNNLQSRVVLTRDSKWMCFKSRVAVSFPQSSSICSQEETGYGDIKRCKKVVWPRQFDWSECSSNLLPCYHPNQLLHSFLNRICPYIKMCSFTVISIMYYKDISLFSSLALEREWRQGFFLPALGHSSPWIWKGFSGKAAAN